MKNLIASILILTGVLVINPEHIICADYGLNSLSLTKCTTITFDVPMRKCLAYITLKGDRLKDVAEWIDNKKSIILDQDEILRAYVY